MRHCESYNFAARDEHRTTARVLLIVRAQSEWAVALGVAWPRASHVVVVVVVVCDFTTQLHIAGKIINSARQLPAINATTRRISRGYKTYRLVKPRNNSNNNNKCLSGQTATKTRSNCSRRLSNWISTHAHYNRCPLVQAYQLVRSIERTSEGCVICESDETIAR